MSQPLSLPPGPVRIVCTRFGEPFVTRGEVIALRQGAWVAAVEHDLGGIEPGSRALISPESVDGTQVVTTITGARGKEMIGVIRSIRRSERRDWPRLHGGIQLLYATIGDRDEAADAWLEGGTGEVFTWYEPDEYMNFSVSGLAFDTCAGCEPGQRLLLEFGVRQSTSRWRCSGRVIRVIPVPEDELDEDLRVGGAPVTDRVALHFEVIPEEASIALAEATLDLQEIGG